MLLAVEAVEAYDGDAMERGFSSLPIDFEDCLHLPIPGREDRHTLVHLAAAGGHHEIILEMVFHLGGILSDVALTRHSEDTPISSCSDAETLLVLLEFGAATGIGDLSREYGRLEQMELKMPGINNLVDEVYDCYELRIVDENGDENWQGRAVDVNGLRRQTGEFITAEEDSRHYRQVQAVVKEFRETG